MRLGAMADALEAQRRAPEVHELSFEERLGLLVDQEWTARRDRRLARLLKEARLRLPAAPAQAGCPRGRPAAAGKPRRFRERLEARPRAA
jgi:hypothetical protein